MNVEPSFLFRLLIPLRRLLPDEITASTLHRLILSWENLKKEKCDYTGNIRMARLNFKFQFDAKQDDSRQFHLPLSIS